MFDLSLPKALKYVFPERSSILDPQNLWVALVSCLSLGFAGEHSTSRITFDEQMVGTAKAQASVQFDPSHRRKHSAGKLAGKARLCSLLSGWGQMRVCPIDLSHAPTRWPFCSPSGGSCSAGAK